MFCICFFFNDTATTEIYTLSLHDALPISRPRDAVGARGSRQARPLALPGAARSRDAGRAARNAARPGARCGERSEEHTSELQSRQYLVCRLLLEKNKNR